MSDIRKERYNKSFCMVILYGKEEEIIKRSITQIGVLK